MPFFTFEAEGFLEKVLLVATRDTSGTCRFYGAASSEEGRGNAIVFATLKKDDVILVCSL